MEDKDRESKEKSVSREPKDKVGIFFIIRAKGLSFCGQQDKDSRSSEGQGGETQEQQQGQVQH